MTRSNSRMAVWLGGGVCVVFAVLLLLASRGGPDYTAHLQWARALVTGDLFSIESRTASPMGLPVSQWQAGTGLFFAWAEFLPWRGHGNVIGDFRIVGWLAALALWWAMWRVLLRCSGGEVRLAILGLATAFVATPLGFYSVWHSSEVFACALLALMLERLTDPSPWSRKAVAGMGIMAALVVVVRLNLAPYAMVLLVGVVATWSRSWNEGKDGKLSKAWMLALLAPLVLAAVQVGMVNQWMTGTAYCSPLIFWDEGFRSMDWQRPEFAAVLMSPWHGLLAYHPVFLLAIACMVLATRQSPDPARRLVYGLGLLAIAVNLWSQAAWYCWWMGTGSFGSRGMVPAALLAIPALIEVVRGAGVRMRVVFLLMILVMFFWSGVLLSLGITNFMTWRELHTAVSGWVLDWRHLMVPVLIAAAGAAGTARVEDAEERRLTAVAVLAGGWMLHFMIGDTLRAAGVIGMKGVAWYSGFAAVAAGGAMLVLLRGFPRIAPGPSRAWGWMAVVCAGMLLEGVFLFGALAWGVEHGERALPAGRTRFEWIRPYHVEELRVCGEEYRGVPGFEKAKERFAGFLKRQGLEAGAEAVP